MDRANDTEAEVRLREPVVTDAIDVREIELVGHSTRRPSAAHETLDPAHDGLLRTNLRDPSVRLLFTVLMCAQVADLVTTHFALRQAGLAERNPLFRMLFQSPFGLADAAKLGAVAAISLLALGKLPIPRSRHAMLFAAVISIVAPIANLFTMLGRF